MKTFTSFWLLCSPVKGNFILMCVDGKSVRLLPRTRSFTRCETQSPLPFSSLKVQLWDGCSPFALGSRETCKQPPLQQLPLPTACPRHAERAPKSHIPTEKGKGHSRCTHAFHDEIPVMAGKQTSWSAGSFPDLCPCRTWNSFSSNQLSIFNSYTHTKTTYLQKHAPTNSSECLKMNQLTRNISNRNSYSCIPPEKVLRYGQEKRHLNKYSVCKGSC